MSRKITIIFLTVLLIVFLMYCLAPYCKRTYIEFTVSKDYLTDKYNFDEIQYLYDVDKDYVFKKNGKCHGE